MDPALQSALERYASFAVLAVLTVLALVARARARDVMLRADLRGAIWLLVAAIVARLLHRLADAAGAPEAIVTVFHVATLALAAFGGIRLAISGALWLARRQGKHTPKILRDVIDGALYVIASAIILKTTFDLDLTALVTTSALLSVVLGLALQDTLGNLFAGLSLQVEGPMTPGDWVQIDQHIGQVVEISWRAVKLETRRRELVTIPNNVLAKGVISNLSRRLGGAVFRELFVHVGYGVPPNVVKEHLTAVVVGNPQVLAQPEPEIVLMQFADSGIQYRLRFWVPRYELARFVDDDVLSAAWYRLNRHGLEIPFPVRTVYLRRDKPREGLPPPDRDQNVATAEKVRVSLGKIELLAPLGDAALDRLAAEGRREIYGRHEVVFRQGEPGSTFYVIVEGEVEVHVAGVAAPVAVLGPGQFFGEMALLTGDPRSASITARTDLAVVGIDRAVFASVIQGSPSAAEKLAAALAERRAGPPQATVGPGPQAARDVPAETGRIFGKLRDLFLKGGGGGGSGVGG